jgi:hypothetical protein
MRPYLPRILAAAIVAIVSIALGLTVDSWPRWVLTAVGLPTEHSWARWSLIGLGVLVLIAAILQSVKEVRHKP